MQNHASVLALTGRGLTARWSGLSWPLLARVREHGVVSQLTTQFPSTTTAHVTTLHTAQPVGQHGAYEWYIYEPSLDRIVCPLMAAFAGGEPGDLIAAGADLHALYPQADGLAERLARLGAECHIVQPAETIDTPRSNLYKKLEQYQISQETDG